MKGPNLSDIIVIKFLRISSYTAQQFSIIELGFHLVQKQTKKKKNKGFLAKWFFSTDLIKIWAQEILIFGEYILECNAMENVYDLISENVG